MRLRYKTDGGPFTVHIFAEIEFPDCEYYPVRFEVEMERVDAGHVEIIGRPMWSEEFYDIAQNALIRRFAESKEMGRLIDEYIENEIESDNE